MMSPFYPFYAAFYAFKLAPAPARLAALGRDYQAMRDMHLTQSMDFEQIPAALTDLEKQINGAVGP